MLKIRSKIAIKVLNYFFLNPSEKRYLKELADILILDGGNLFRKMKELEDEGIFISERKGNQKYYCLNKKYPFLKELKRSFEAKYGWEKKLALMLENLKGLKEAFVFGSYSKGDFQTESDIDVLLIGNHSSLEAKRLILPMQKVIGREINIIDISPKELIERRRKKDEFIKNIFSQKLIKIF